MNEEAGKKEMKFFEIFPCAADKKEFIISPGKQEEAQKS